MKLYEFQEQALAELEAGSRFLIAGTGSGKGSVMLHWLRSTGKQKWLMVTTASKRDSGDMEAECDAWFGEELRQSLSCFSVISWAGLGKWLSQHSKELDEWAIAFDEIHFAKSGVSSQRGTAFLRIANQTDCWTGYTATPGDRWIDFYPYFTACGFVKHKTQFQRDFCIMQTFKGYPEIVEYKNTDQLKEWWRQVSYVPDTSEMERQIPKANHMTVRFKKPQGYDKVVKTHCDLDGNLLETNSAYCHYLRQMCGGKPKLEWVRDFLDGLQAGCVIFYNYIAEGDALEEVAKKVRKDSKIWRIDGKHHDIPTAETIGERDVVLAQWTSGSASLNLQFLNYWVSFSPNYSYTISVQGKGRIRRIGQDKPQFYYFLRTTDTIEDDIYECLHNKKDFSAEVWCGEERN